MTGSWQHLADLGGDPAVGGLAATADALDADPALAAWFGARTAELATAELWDAAVLVQGWIGEPGFAAVRAWLVARGEETFDAVRKDPDNLADVYRWRAELDDPALVRLRAFASPAAAADLPGEWTNISDDRAVKARFPRLQGLVDARRCR